MTEQKPSLYRLPSESGGTSLPSVEQPSSPQDRPQALGASSTPSAPNAKELELSGIGKKLQPFYLQEVEVDLSVVKTEIRGFVSRLSDGALSFVGVALLLSLSLSLWGWMAAPEFPKPPVPQAERSLEDTALIARGKEVYRKHGLWMYANLRDPNQSRGGWPTMPFSEAWLTAYFADPRLLAGQIAASPRPQLLQRDPQGRLSLNPEGKALLAYLQSLAPIEHKDGYTESERHGKPRLSIDIHEGRRLYKRLCASCHGEEGQGSGVLAKKLGLTIPDLAHPTAILCRSDRQPRADDVLHAIERGRPHTGMLPLSRSLTPSQIASLAEAIRQMLFLQEDGEPHYMLQRPLPQAPVQAQVERADFRKWLDGWWGEEYKTWKEEKARRLARSGFVEAHWKEWLKDQHFGPWKERREWQRFSQWIRSDPRRLRISRADWAAAMMKKFQKSRMTWLAKARHQPFTSWLQTSLEQQYDQLQITTLKKPSPSWFGRTLERLRLRNADAPESKPQRDAWLHAQGFRSHDAWREEEERATFKRWQETSTALMFRAWQGREVYRESGCITCHGSEGKGEMIQLPLRETVGTDKELYRMTKVPSFGQLRCGSSPSDIQRSILAGPHAALLGRSDLYSYLRRLPIPPPSAKPYSLADVRFWALVTYIRFLHQDLPFNRPLHRP